MVPLGKAITAAQGIYGDAQGQNHRCAARILTLFGADSGINLPKIAVIA
jgi:hypothetical protein